MNQYDHWPSQEEREEMVLDQLPSRKVTHPRPTSFLEKPTFSLILFILFIVVLCGILFSYIYDNYQRNDKKRNQDIKKEQQITPESSGNQSKDIQPSIPVVVIPPITDPVIDEEEVQQEEERPADMDTTSIIHTVQENENLYRIARKYYNNGSVEYREIIKKANGLTNDTIIKGMKLIIPLPIHNP